jgi:hypothetical protein
MEHPMPESTVSDSPSPVSEDHAIRERARGLTSQVLQQGRVDPEAVRDVVRAVIGGGLGNANLSSDEARTQFVHTVRELDHALVQSATATHEALQLLASRGKDFTDNDLKDALSTLGRLEQDYAALASRITDVMSGNLRREMAEIAVHAQNVGVEASARVASMVGDFSGAVGATPGLATIRDAGVRVALLASGVLAGVADALREQTESKDGK